MAEALWKSLAKGKWQSESAGSKPSGYVHPLAIQAMQELGSDISANTSKSLDLFRDEPFDLVVTVCDHAKESCPVCTKANQTLHWPFDDPADASGTQAEQMIVFRRVRDEIRKKIGTYLQTQSSGENR